jgi:hypothetical protein
MSISRDDGFNISGSTGRKSSGKTSNLWLEDAKRFTQNNIDGAEDEV